MKVEPFTYGSACLFLTPVWIELLSDKESAVLLKPLSYAKLSAIQDLLYLKKQDDKFFKFDTYQTMLEECVLSTRNLIGFPDFKTVLSQLPPKDLKYLYE